MTQQMDSLKTNTNLNFKESQMGDDNKKTNKFKEKKTNCRIQQVNE